MILNFNCSADLNSDSLVNKIEAGILTKDPFVVKDAINFFETCWKRRLMFIMLLSNFCSKLFL